MALENLKQSAPSNLAEKMTRKEMLIKEKDGLEKEIDEINNDSEESINKTKNINVINKAIKQQDLIIEQVQGNIALRADVEKLKEFVKI